MGSGGTNQLALALKELITLLRRHRHQQHTQTLNQTARQTMRELLQEMVSAHQGGMRWVEVASP